MSLRNLDSRGNRRNSVLPTAVCRLLLILITAHCTLHTSSASTWQRQKTSSLAWLHAVFFVDQHRGWSVGSRGTLLATADGGRSWQKKAQPTSDVIRDVYFQDELTGWIVCERNIYELKSNDEPRSYLMNTVDGGETWKRVAVGGADARLMRAVFGLAGRGWVFGEGGSVFTTHDAGGTWAKKPVPTRYLLLGGTFIDERNGWLVGAGSTLLQTADGGETWHHGRLQQTANVRFNSTSFVNARLGWAVGGGGAIYRTSNGGASWQAQRSGVTTDLLDVKFLDHSQGWAVGAEGIILQTTNGGLRWTVERSGTPHALERIFFTDRTHGWAVGFGGTIIAYGGPSGPAEPPRLRR
ncbi:MAG TPA: YCF48-related protein [Pyrinomonadaceae bacterium]|nr:YCF48-related protein [Pyrinomonadaceae bacterium]